MNEQPGAPKKLFNLPPLTKNWPKIEQSLKKQWQELHEQMKQLQSGELLATAEADINQIKEKYHEQFVEYNRKIAEYDQSLYERQSSLPLDSETLPFRKSLEEEPVLDPRKREHAISALLKSASANGLEGLYLTPKVFDVICSLLDSKEIPAIYMLLPYLRGIEPSLIPLLNIWVVNPPDKVVWAYAGLLLAEIGQVNSHTIPCLIELIENGIDIGHYRAGIVLYGSDISFTKKNRNFRASQLGVQSLLLVAQATQRLQSERAQIADQIAWTWHNIIYDDPPLLQQLVHYSEREEGSEGGVSDLLKSISYCDDDCLNAIVNQFEEGSEKTQELLLHSWLELLWRHFSEKITLIHRKRVKEVISKVSSSILENFKVIPQRLGTITNILVSVGKQIEEKQITFQQATSVLNQELSALALKLPDTSIEELSKHRFYTLNLDPQRALEGGRIR